LINERITDEVANTVCKMGQREACCRYLSMGKDGWSCLKHSELRSYIDMRADSKTMNARGDNCEGRLE
jgi:hypothetical protein